MAPMFNHTGYAHASTPLTPEAIDQGSAHRRHQKQPRFDHLGNNSVPGPTRSIVQANNAEGSEDCSKCDQEADQGDNDSDAAEADEGDDDDGNGDVNAPSGCAFVGHTNQAGHSVTTDEQQVMCKRSQDEIAQNSKSSPQTAEPTGIPRQTMAGQNQDSDSDDEAYNGVDDISEMSAEMFAGSWPGFDTDDGLFLDEIPYFDEHYLRTEPGILASDIRLYQDTSVYHGVTPMPSLSQPQSSPTRRVRFKDPAQQRVQQIPDGSDILSHDEDLNYLFDPLTSSGANVTHSLYNDREKYESDDESTGGNSSGYETDYGGTTDEDVPASATKRPQSLLRQPSLSSLELDLQFQQIAASSRSSANHSRPPSVPATPMRDRLGPRLGSFKTNLTKHVFMMDCTGDTMVTISAKQPPPTSTSFSQVTSTRGSTAHGSPVVAQANFATTLHQSATDLSDFSSHVNRDPMLAHGSATFAGALSANGAANATFYPADLVDNMEAMSRFGGGEDEDNVDDDGDINVNDFIRFSDTSDDEEQAEEPGPEFAFPSPISPSPAGVSIEIRHKTPSPTESSTNDVSIEADSLLSPSRKRKSSEDMSPSGSHGPRAKKRVVPT